MAGHNPASSCIQAQEKAIDQPDKAALQIPQPLTFGAAIRSDRNPAHKPGSRYLISLIPEFGSQQWFKEGRVDPLTQAINTVFPGRDGIQLLTIYGSGPEDKEGEPDLLKKREERIPGDLEGCCKGVNPLIFHISCAPFLPLEIPEKIKFIKKREEVGIA
jgi:hypothetical protein